MRDFKTIEEGFKILDESYFDDSVSKEDYRAIYRKLAAQFLKDEFGIEDINSLSKKARSELFDKLVTIECEDPLVPYDEENDRDVIYPARWHIATSLVTEMGDGSL